VHIAVDWLRFGDDSVRDVDVPSELLSEGLRKSMFCFCGAVRVRQWLLCSEPRCVRDRLGLRCLKIFCIFTCVEGVTRNTNALRLMEYMFMDFD
jgi:hypothetical protein